MPGVPDIFVLRLGSLPACIYMTGPHGERILKECVLYGIEVKTEIGKQSAEQKEFEYQFVSNGGRYVIARSVDDIIKAGL